MPQHRSEMGRRIAIACAHGDLSMGQLADEIQLSRQNLSKIISGKTKDPRSSIIVRLAKRLGVSTDYLLGLTDDRTPPGA